MQSRPLFSINIVGISVVAWCNLTYFTSALTGAIWESSTICVPGDCAVLHPADLGQHHTKLTIVVLRSGANLNTFTWLGNQINHIAK